MTNDEVYEAVLELLIDREIKADMRAQEAARWLADYALRLETQIRLKLERQYPDPIAYAELDDLPQLMTYAEVAGFLRIKKRMLHKRINYGHIKIIKIGPKSTRIHKEDLKALLADREEIDINSPAFSGEGKKEDIHLQPRAFSRP